MSDPITFSGSPLDRVSIERRDASFIEKLRADEATRFLPVHRLEPLVKLGAERSLAWATNALLDGIDPDPPAVLLGLGDGVAHFAVDVSTVEDPVSHFGLEGVAAFEDLRAIAAQLAPGDTAIAAQARALVDWHARHGFCAVCGATTVPEMAGAHRRCIACAAEHFPRTDPVAIAVVVRGDRCLLGRNPGWPATMFSALAGFIEAGETIEEAVRREVLEESGIRVGDVRYLKSQPWPFPSSLMIGCIAEALSEEITIDPAELEDARWFTRDALRAALAGDGSALIVPPRFAVAHHLIRAWVDPEAD
ncbi:MAG: NAD(+) diphosphatase [Myxococcales bacterium]|nr:NAD(+) diphosphatase [Myxococcales bacterium]